MASNFTVNGSNTTVSFSWTSTTSNIQNIVGGCAELLWNRGLGDHGTDESPILFSSLTNAQKLTLVENYLKSVVIDTANTNKSLKAQDAARATEESNKLVL